MDEHGCCARHWGGEPGPGTAVPWQSTLLQCQEDTGRGLFHTVLGKAQPCYSLDLWFFGLLFSVT